jgi:hypothetical protein
MGMPCQPAKQALLNVWPLLYSAQNRQLSSSEINDLERACSVLVVVAGSRHYADEAQEFCRAVHSSGVLQTGRIADANELLAQIDALRDLLE